MLSVRRSIIRGTVRIVSTVYNGILQLTVFGGASVSSTRSPSLNAIIQFENPSIRSTVCKKGLFRSRYRTVMRLSFPGVYGTHPHLLDTSYPGTPAWFGMVRDIRQRCSRNRCRATGYHGRGTTVTLCSNPPDARGARVRNSEESRFVAKLRQGRARCDASKKKAERKSKRQNKK